MDAAEHSVEGRPGALLGRWEEVGVDPQREARIGVAEGSLTATRCDRVPFPVTFRNVLRLPTG